MKGEEGGGVTIPGTTPAEMTSRRRGKGISLVLWTALTGAFSLTGLAVVLGRGIRR